MVWSKIGATKKSPNVKRANLKKSYIKKLKAYLNQTTPFGAINSRAIVCGGLNVCSGRLGPVFSRAQTFGASHLQKHLATEATKTSCLALRRLSPYVSVELASILHAHHCLGVFCTEGLEKGFPRELDNIV